jgi:hypothetical protein
MHHVSSSPSPFNNALFDKMKHSNRAYPITLFLPVAVYKKQSTTDTASITPNQVWRSVVPRTRRSVTSNRSTIVLTPAVARS